MRDCGDGDGHGLGRGEARELRETVTVEPVLGHVSLCTISPFLPINPLRLDIFF